jgi:hypothetical protein
MNPPRLCATATHTARKVFAIGADEDGN